MKGRKSKETVFEPAPVSFFIHTASLERMAASNLECNCRPLERMEVGASWSCPTLSSCILCSSVSWNRCRRIALRLVLRSWPGIGRLCAIIMALLHLQIASIYGRNSAARHWEPFTFVRNDSNGAIKVIAGCLFLKIYVVMLDTSIFFSFFSNLTTEPHTLE